MATSSSSATSVSLADCPQCGYLCLGPTILPCDHLTCKKCLRHLLQQHGSKRTCRSCGRCISLPKDQAMLSVSQLVQQLGTDPVMESLVLQELRNQGDVRCVLCPNKKASSVCLDCQEYFCDNCSSHHQRLNATRDHSVEFLPQSLCNVSSMSSRIGSLRFDSVLSARSADSIRNPASAEPRATAGEESESYEQWKQRLKKEVKLLQEAASDQHTVVTALENILSLGQQLLKTAQTEQQLLNTYTDCLALYDATEQPDKQTYVISLAGPDVTAEVKTEAFERRLLDVTKRSHSFRTTSLRSIRHQLGQPLHIQAEEADEDEDEQEDEAGDSDLPLSKSFTDITESNTSTKNPTSRTPTPTPTADLTTTTPRRVFVFTPTSAGDLKEPSIASIISTKNDKLVMADSSNSALKVVDLADPYKLSAFLELEHAPQALAVLSDGVVASTSSDTVIYLLRVTESVSLISRIKTARRYSGVAGNDDDTLIVSFENDDDDPARVDVISRRGDVLRTVGDERLTGLKWPRYLCAVDDHVFVSDYYKHIVFKLELTTGRVVEALTHENMSWPQQVAADKAGNLYVASLSGHGILAWSSRGEWRRLLQGNQEAKCVCVTGSGRLVVVWHRDSIPSMVTCYDLD